MSHLEQGSHGPEVRMLQLQLRALGYYEDDIDASFGPITKQALRAFQRDYENLTVTGVLDDETEAALAQALAMRDGEGTVPDDDTDAPPVPCDPEIWKAFLALRDAITETPVRYGPGRGLFTNGRWIVTHGPGKLGSKGWKSAIGATYPSFHCSSWTNFFLGWLLRYNDRYTHSGNIPPLFDLCEKSDDLHPQRDGGADYRGYGPFCRAILPNGEAFERVGVRKVLDIQEIHDRRASLPTFVVCGQSSKKDNGWKWWHHTVLFVIDHHAPDHPLYRLAADGFKGANGAYSAKAMRWIAIDDAWIETNARKHLYRGYGVVSKDGTYGEGGDLCSVEVEP